MGVGQQFLSCVSPHHGRWPALGPLGRPHQHQLIAPLYRYRTVREPDNDFIPDHTFWVLTLRVRGSRPTVILPRDLIACLVPTPRIPPGHQPPICWHHHLPSVHPYPSPNSSSSSSRYRKSTGSMTQNPRRRRGRTLRPWSKQYRLPVQIPTYA